MKKIKPEDINKYKGCFLSHDVFYHSRILFKENSLIDKDVINTILEKKDDIKTYIFITDNKSELNNKDEMIKFFKNEIDRDIKCLFDQIFLFYSYGTLENEEDLFKTIFDFFLKNVFDNKFLYRYLKSLYLFNIELFNHSIRTAILSLVLSLKANMNFDIIINTTIGALLHDIGKIKLYCNYPILANTSHIYSIDEQYLLQIHPIIGFNEVKDVESLSTLSKKIVLYHHVWEEYDQSYSSNKDVFLSYPRYYGNYLITKNDKDICVGIVQICNTYDYMMNSKLNIEATYDVKKSDIIEFIFENSGIIFKPAAVKIFLQYFSLFKLNLDVILTDGRLAKVYKHTSDPKYPLVKIIDTKEIIQLDSNLRIANFTNINSDKERNKNYERIQRYYNL